MRDLHCPISFSSCGVLLNTAAVRHLIGVIVPDPM